jgi:hypothetical protein
MRKLLSRKNAHQVAAGVEHLLGEEETVFAVEIAHRSGRTSREMPVVLFESFVLFTQAIQSWPERNVESMTKRRSLTIGLWSNSRDMRN